MSTRRNIRTWFANKEFRLLFAMSLAVLLFQASIIEARSMEPDATTQRANILLREYATFVGVAKDVDTTLDDHGARSFGSYDFQLNAVKHLLRVRVFLVDADNDRLPEAAKSAKVVDAALFDPKIGGMYDRAGGFFTRDDKLKVIFLTKDIDISKITDREWVQEVEHLRIVDARWFHSWFRHVAAQALGKEAPPTRKITLQNDPYLKE